MTTTPRRSPSPQPEKPRPTLRRKRIRLPMYETGDLSLVQQRNRQGARRRLKLAAEKLEEAWWMLPGASAEVDTAMLQKDVWMAMQIAKRARAALVLKRGRKPRPALDPAPAGKPADGTTIVAL